MSPRKPFSMTNPLAALAALLIAAVTTPTLAAEQTLRPAGEGPMREFTRTLPPRPVPAFTFADQAGRPLSLADFQGQVVVLNIWATWCVPCVKEMPALDRLQGKLAGDKARVLAISIDRGGAAQVLPFYERLRIGNLAVHVDSQAKVWSALSVKALPLTLVIDPKGREVGRIEGAAEWDAPEAVALVRSYLAP